MRYKTIIKSTLAIMATCIVAGLSTNVTHAESSSANANVKVAPTITLTLTGGDLVIDNLAPGASSDSNIITASITTNATWGYYLSATTGTASGTTNLVNSADSNYIFTNLNSNKPTLADFSDSTWGYAYSINNGSTWISGDNGSALSGYNGLPLDHDDNGATGVKLLATNSLSPTGSVKFKIGAKTSATQPAGTYNGVVNFYAVTNPEPVPTLYDSVASMSKGKQTVADIQTDITVPTSADRAEDTSNSGVYEYDPSVFGVASDAADDHTIYYYRGVLENTVGSYGSDGSAVTYPNYVVLSTASDKTGLANTDTCWRIVRTTGSGGVKMIYNGLWTGSTCANATTAAQVTTNAFNGISSTNQQIVRVGYTYNSTYATNTASTASIGNVLGTNSNPGVNDASSDMKTYIEGTWFSNISSYESMLEPSAGYCNDRTVYDNTSPYTLQSEDTNIVTYGSDVAVLRFGSHIRNNYALSANNNRTLTLNCARNVVDLYTTNSATDGNKQLGKPAALLTADEVAFAGSGTSTATQGSAYNANSYLRSGSNFWLLSPSYRYPSGTARGFRLMSSNGSLYGDDIVNYARGVRPAISLTSGTTATSGAGIATDPWIVNPSN